MHARSSIARGRYWQANQMIDGVRDRVGALACLRYGLPAHQGRGLDDLPAEVTTGWGETLVRAVEPADLHRALDGCLTLLRDEVRAADPALADRLTVALAEMARPN